MSATFRNMLIALGLVISVAIVLPLTGFFNEGGRFNFFPYARIAALKTQMFSLEAELAGLPQRHDRWMGERFGYHSAFTTPAQEGGTIDMSIELRFNRVSPVIAVALAPAVNPEGDRERTYGFPRRFKIEFYLDTEVEPVYVIDYTQEDFPDPGIAPVIFDGLNFRARTMKISVERGQIAKGMEFFALSEIFIFEEREDGIDNIAPYTKRFVSHLFESYPYWDQRFMTDRNSSLGQALGVETKEETDFIGEFIDSFSNDQVQIVFDLGQTRTLGRAAFYPASPKTGILLPHFGFPNEIYIEVFDDAELAKPLYRVDVVPDYKVRDYHRDISYRPLTDMFFAVPLADAKGRYVRVTTSGLQSYGNNPVLGFGEIVFSRGDKNFSTGSKVSVHTLMKPVEPIDPQRLVDGYANSQKIIDTYVWLKALQERDRLERDLAGKALLLEADQATLAHSWKVLVATVVAVFAIVALWGIAALRLAANRSMRAVREQISRDLHDDVGCNISALSLGIGNLQAELQGEVLAGNAEELRLVAQETAVALEEAVYFTSRGVIMLSDLVLRLKERARIILGDRVGVTFTVADNLPDMPIDFSVKRHLLLFYKEALHNCVKHSQATKVDIHVGVDGGDLSVRVSDNGIGFDRERLARASGLRNMQMRATRVNGALHVDSAPGRGTTLDFRLAIVPGAKGA